MIPSNPHDFRTPRLHAPEDPTELARQSRSLAATHSGRMDSLPELSWLQANMDSPMVVGASFAVSGAAWGAARRVARRRTAQVTVAGAYGLAAAFLGEASLCCPRVSPPREVDAPRAQFWSQPLAQIALLGVEASLMGCFAGFVAVTVPLHVLVLGACTLVFAAMWGTLHWSRLRAAGFVSFLGEESRKSLLET